MSGDYGHFSLKESYSIINSCIDNQYFHFDTAPNYGKGKIEKIIGKYTNSNKNLIIDTKIGNSPNNIKSFKKIDLKKSFFSSLDRLKLGQINTLYLHNPRVTDIKILKLIDLLNEFKEKNLCNKIGISLAKDYIYKTSILKKFDIVQVDFNILRPLDYSLTSLTNLYARSIYASGILSKNKSLKFNDFNKKGDHRSVWLQKERLEYLNTQLFLIRNIIDRSLKDFAFDYVVQKSNISKAIIGIKKLKQFNDLNNMVKKFNRKIINRKLITKIDNLIKKDTSFKNKDLNY